MQAAFTRIQSDSNSTDRFNYVTTDVPNPADYTWNFTVVDCVGIWDLTEMTNLDDAELEAVTDHYRLRGSEEDINATLAVFTEDFSLPKETQEFMQSQWSENAKFTGVDRAGFVSNGIKAMAVLSNIDFPEGEADSFKDLDKAVEWARGACPDGV